jgi:hypothetical protein
VEDVIDFPPLRDAQEYPLQFGNIVSRVPEAEHRRHNGAVPLAVGALLL